MAQPEPSQTQIDYASTQDKYAISLRNCRKREFAGVITLKFLNLGVRESPVGLCRATADYVGCK